MGLIQAIPKREKSSDIITLNGSPAAAYSAMQGVRPSMEDAHVVQLAADEKSQEHVVAVFDGHGGDKTSLRCEQILVENIRKQRRYKVALEKNEFASWKNVLSQAFIDIDEDVAHTQHTAEGFEYSGSTGVVAVINQGKVFVANAGDSRAVLCSGDVAVAMSEDHKPEDDKELQRINSAGAFVMNGRVNGELAVARAFGDFSMKGMSDLPPAAQPVSVVPDVVEQVINDEAQFLLLACDGIWDVMSNQVACDYLLRRIQDEKEPLDTACNRLLDECLELGSKDNMSVVVFTFPKVRAILEANSSLAEAKREQYARDLQAKIEQDKEQ